MMWMLLWARFVLLALFVGLVGALAWTQLSSTEER